MLALTLTGVSSSPQLQGTAIRESPTLLSRGQTFILPQADGSYRIGSFFDIFTEITLNGGANWFPADRPLHVVFVPNLCVQVICPPDAVVECPKDTSPASTGTATVQNICSATASLTFQDQVIDQGCHDHLVRVIQRTWIATDAWGSVSRCVQTIKVIDTTPPEVTCPPDVAIDCKDSVDPAFNPKLGVATASDTCTTASGPIFEDIVTPGNCRGNYSIKRTWTSMDDCGNVGFCVQRITVTDTTGPMVTCPPDVTISCTDSTDPTVNLVLGVATAEDDCSGASKPRFDDIATPGDCPGNSFIKRT